MTLSLTTRLNIEWRTLDTAAQLLSPIKFTLHKEDIQSSHCCVFMVIYQQLRQRVIFTHMHWSNSDLLSSAIHSMSPTVKQQMLPCASSDGEALEVCYRAADLTRQHLLLAYCNRMMNILKMMTH